MVKIQFTSLLFALSILLVSSCSNEEGKGGQATLTGKVIIRDIDPTDNSVINEYDAIDQPVFLTYGDNEIYDDDFKTDLNGAYKFEGLRPGKYFVKSYLQCKDCIEATEIVSEEVNIEDKKGSTEAPTIYLSNKSVEDGAVTVIGKVVVHDSIRVLNSFNIYNAYDYDVFIVYGNETVYRDDFTTDINGGFRFDGLKKGTYKVYTYPKCKDCTQIPTATIVEKKFTVEVNNGTVTIPDLIVEIKR